MGASPWRFSGEDPELVRGSIRPICPGNVGLSFGERNVWGSLLNLLPLWSNLGKAEHKIWMDFCFNKFKLSWKPKTYSHVHYSTFSTSSDINVLLLSSMMAAIFSFHQVKQMNEHALNCSIFTNTLCPSSCLNYSSPRIYKHTTQFDTHSTSPICLANNQPRL